MTVVNWYFYIHISAYQEPVRIKVENFDAEDESSIVWEANTDSHLLNDYINNDESIAYEIAEKTVEQCHQYIAQCAQEQREQEKQVPIEGWEDM